MSEKPNQPREYDAVLGGNAPPPVNGVVLGGIEGVKSRLASAVVEARIAALKEALKYGDAGLDLVIGALKDQSKEVQRSACLLLRESADLKGRQALVDYDPWLVFTTLANWKVENFDPKVGITEPVGTAYVVNLEQFKILSQNPQASKVEALFCRTEFDYYNWKNTEFSTFVNALFEASARLTSLKALFIGDAHPENEYMRSQVQVSDISPILETYPNLEVLQIRGTCCGDFCKIYNLGMSGHNHLKTLIFETAWLGNKAIAQICQLNLPALEYFELWGSLDGCTKKSTIDSLTPVLAGKSFPNLIYLGLRSFECANQIVKAIVQAPILDRLSVLDLSMGALTDKGAKALLKSSRAIDRLHTLNVSRNNISTQIIQQLSTLKCRVISEPQADETDRYQASYE